MALVDDFKSSGGNFGRIGEGTFPARITQIIDLGMQENTYEGDTKVQHKIWMTFELPTETIEIDGEQKPRWLSKEFTMSTSDKALLMRVLNAIFTKDELAKVESMEECLGKALLVEVGTTSGGKDKWINSSRMIGGMTVADLSQKPGYYWLDNPDHNIFDSLPDFLKEKINTRIGADDDIPF